MKRVRVGHDTRAFTMLEAMLALLVIVLAGALLVGVLARVRHAARCEQLGTELRALAADFEKYHSTYGRWPETPAKAAELIDDSWPDGSPFGGHYGWVPPEADGRPGRIELTAYIPDFPLTLSRADLLEIDRQIDNGDLTTGRLRTAFNGWPVYLVEAGR
jgi:type II secretory pathway pseudopilin PulG